MKIWRLHHDDDNSTLIIVIQPTKHFWKDYCQGEQQRIISPNESMGRLQWAQMQALEAGGSPGSSQAQQQQRPSYFLIAPMIQNKTLRRMLTSTHVARGK